MRGAVTTIPRWSHLATREVVPMRTPDPTGRVGVSSAALGQPVGRSGVGPDLPLGRGIICADLCED